MYKRNIYKNEWNGIVIAFVAVLCCLSCDNAEYKPLAGDGSERVYISDATTSISGNLTLTSDPVVTKQLVIRLNQASKHDVKVRMALSDDTMAKVNDILGTSYSIFPREYFRFPEEITIPAGEVYGEPFTIEIDNTFDTQGEAYAFPFQIVSCEGARISKASSEFCLMLVKEIGLVDVPVFGRSQAGTTQFRPTDKWDETWPQATIEMWVRRNSFPTNNQHLFTAGSKDDSNDEVYARFGDVDYNGMYNYLQIKVYGAQQKFDTGDPNVDGNGLEANKWYHFAMVFDKGDYRLYKNGIEVCHHAGGNAVLDTDQFILCNFSSAGRETAVCELRMWKSARTPQQIQDYMFIQPRYKDPDLVFYAPMHEGAENSGVFEDVTGNGHDGPMGNNGQGPSAITWEKVNFSSNNADLK